MDDERASKFQSWLDITESYERHVAYSKVYLPILEIVKKISQTERAYLFRAGQSVGRLRISTKGMYGLDPDDPCVIVDLTQDYLFRLRYLSGNMETLEEYISSPDDILSKLLPYDRSPFVGHAEQGNRIGQIKKVGQPSASTFCHRLRFPHWIRLVPRRACERKLIFAIGIH